MGSDVSGRYNRIRAFMVPDPRVKTANLSGQTPAGESDYTQAGPKPGQAVDQNTPASTMVLEPTGTQSADKDLRVRIGQGGFPGTLVRGAGVLWKYEADTDWLGHDVYNVPTGREFLEYVDNSVGTDNVDGPHIVRLDATSSVVAAYAIYTVASGTTRIRIKTMTPSAHTTAGPTETTWTTAAHVSVSPTSMASSDMNPCLVVMQDGRLHLYYWVRDFTALVATIQMQYSDDGGATWSMGSSAVLATSISQAASGSGSLGFDLGRIRAAHSAKSGQVLLVAELTTRDTAKTLTQVLSQWASDDDGLTFSEVETWVADTINGQQPNVLAASNGGFIVIHALVGSTGSGMYRLSNAYEALTTAGTTAMGGLTAGSEVIDVFRDDDQTLYMLWYNANDAVQIVRSQDDGLNWVHLDDGSGAAAFWHADDASTMLSLTELAATAVAGRMVVISKFTTATGTKDDESLICIYGGGSTTHTLPATSLFRIDSTQMAFDRTWIDIEQPGDCADWTATGAGADVLTSGGLNVVTTTGQTRVYADTGDDIGSTDINDTIVVLLELDAETVAASYDYDDIAVTIIHADGTDDYHISIRFNTVGYRVWDHHAAAGVGSSTAADVEAGVQILVIMTKAKVSVIHRRVFSTTDSTRTWTDGPQGSLTSDTSSPVSKSSLRWGHQGRGGLPAIAVESNWRLFHWGVLASGGQDLAGGFTNPADCFPRPLSRFPIGLVDGVKLAALDGPGREGETWNIDTAYDYSIESIDPAISPSPAETWRSTGETQADIVWDLTQHADDARYLTSSRALYIQNGNWRTASLWGKIDGGSWAKIMDLDMAAGQAGLAYTRTGDCIHVNTGSSTDAATWWSFDSMKGATLDLGSSKFRRVSRSGSGRWTDDLTLRPNLFIEGYDETEPASGTMSAWAPQMLAVIHNATQYRHIRLRIDAQTTADGFFQMGVCTLGSLVVLGQPYGWGREEGLQPNAALSEGVAGRRSTRGLGDSRRSVSVAWSVGVDTSQLYGASPLPDYILATSGAEPIAAPADTPDLVRGLVKYLNGLETPVLYLPSIAFGTPDTALLVQVEDAMWGRIMSPVRLQNTGVGDENETEVKRVMSLDFEAEL